MQHSLRGKMASGACHLARGLLAVKVLLRVMTIILFMEVRLTHATLIYAIQSGFMFVMAIMALLGREEMSKRARESARRCMFMECVYLVLRLVESNFNHILALDNTALYISLAVELVAVLLIYLFCSIDKPWKILAGIVYGVFGIFIGAWMLEKKWNFWLIIGILLIYVGLYIWVTKKSKLYRDGMEDGSEAVEQLTNELKQVTAVYTQITIGYEQLKSRIETLKNTQAELISDMKAFIDDKNNTDVQREVSQEEVKKIQAQADWVKSEEEKIQAEKNRLDEEKKRIQAEETRINAQLKEQGIDDDSWKSIMDSTGRKCSYIFIGMLGVLFIANLLLKTIPREQNATIQKSATAYLEDTDYSATMYHVDWEANGRHCETWLYIRGEIYNTSIGEIAHVGWNPLKKEGESQHFDNVRWIKLSWQDEETVLVNQSEIEVFPHK